MEGLLKLWIIHRQIGAVIFEQTFDDMPTDINSDMIGGFLIAILSFSEEIAKQEIEYLQLKDMRLIYHIAPKYIIAVATNNRKNYDSIENALSKVETRFEENYSSILKNFTGEISVFNNFGSDIEGIFDTKSKSLKFLETQHEKIKEYYQEQQIKVSDFLHKLVSNLKDNEKTRENHEGSQQLEPINKKTKIKSTLSKPIYRFIERIGDLSKKVSEKLKNQTESKEE
jgi:hypothetical protein